MVDLVHVQISRKLAIFGDERILYHYTYYLISVLYVDWSLCVIWIHMEHINSYYRSYQYQIISVWISRIYLSLPSRDGPNSLSVQTRDSPCWINRHTLLDRPGIFLGQRLESWCIWHNKLLSEKHKKKHSQLPKYTYVVFSKTKSGTNCLLGVRGISSIS